MRRKMFFLGAALILSIAFAVETYSDFASYNSERSANVSIVSPPDALISFTCGQSLAVTANDTASAIATVLTNTLDKPIDVNVYFYGWVGFPSGLGLEVQQDSSSFNLAPGGNKDIWVTVSASEEAPAGTYGAILRIVAFWDGGYAEILTSPCPLQVIVSAPAPSRTISKTLVIGDTSVPTGTYLEWTMRISAVAISSSDIVEDTIPGEFYIVNGISLSKGTYSLTYTGGATHIEWVLGSIGSATMNVTIATKTTPSGQQQFVSPGTYNLNDGACFKGTTICTSKITVVAGG